MKAHPIESFGRSVGTALESVGQDLCYVPNGPRPLTSTGRHGHFLNSTCDIGHGDMQQGGKIYSDMGHSLFLN